MKKNDDSQLLLKLQSEAKLQSQLYANRLMPEQLDSFTSLIGRYPWQSLVLMSGILAIGVELFRYWWYIYA